MSFSLHVGSDADMTNKIQVNIETMNSDYLGVKNLNIADDSGKAATYAIDAISRMLYLRYLLSVPLLVLFRTVLSTQLTTWITLLRTPHPLSLVSVIQTWQKRWLLIQEQHPSAG